MIEFKAPEATTVIRWCLRFVLVMFLAWLVKRKPEEDEDQDNDENEDAQRRENGRHARGAQRIQARVPRPRDPYNTTQFRQRRPMQETTDFDSVIDKMSKPKDMWEIRKDGGPISTFRKTSSTSLSGLQQLVQETGVQESSAVRTPLKLTSKRNQPGEDGSEPAWKKDFKMTLHAHTRPVTCITFNMDGKLLFTCGKDKRICVWSFPENEQLGAYEGHNGAVWACSITPDSSYLVSAGADRLVIVWEARTSKEITRVELPAVVRSVEWAGCWGDTASNGGAPRTERFVAAHTKAGSAVPPGVTVWSFNGEVAEKLSEFTLPSPCSQVRWGKNDETLVTAHEGELVFWSVTGEELRRLRAHDAAVLKFDFSTDREVVATASLDSTVKLWDLSTADDRLIYQLKADRPLNCVALGPISRAVATGPATARPKRACVIAAGGQDARDVTTTKSGNNQFETMLCNLGNGEEEPSELQGIGSVKGHFGPVHTLAFTADGTAMASGSEDGFVRLHMLDESLEARKASE